MLVNLNNYEWNIGRNNNMLKNCDDKGKTLRK